MEHSKRKSSKYKDKGIMINPAVPAKGEAVRILYTGLLSQSGADKVYVHVGFGGNWQSAMDYKMVRTLEGFVADIPVTTAAPLAMCFKDSAGNWDNNSGQNYTIEILE